MSKPDPVLDLSASTGQMQLSVRFELLNRELRKIGSLRTMEASSVTINSSGSVKRTLGGVQLLADDLDQINPFSDRVRPVMWTGAGTQHPLGVFVFTHLSERVRRGTSLFDATLLDQGFMLDQGSTASYALGPGGDLLRFLVQLLTDSGVSKDRMRLPYGGNPTVLDPIGWPRNTARAKIADEVCTLAGWLPLYFDRDGWAVVRDPPQADEFDHDYPLRGNRVNVDSIVRSDDLLEAPNVIIVENNGSTPVEISAVYEIPSRVPWSVHNRGFQIPYVHQAQGIPSSAAAERMAVALAAKVVGFENLEFDGTPDPRHDVHCQVRFDGKVYREVSSSLQLRPPYTHHHSLTRSGMDPSGTNTGRTGTQR